MKITREKLKQIIKEELEANIDESILGKISRAVRGVKTIDTDDLEAVDAHQAKMVEKMLEVLKYASGRGPEPDMKEINKLLRNASESPNLTADGREVREAYAVDGQGSSHPFTRGNKVFDFLVAYTQGYFDQPLYYNKEIDLYYELTAKGSMPRVQDLEVFVQKFGTNRKVPIRMYGTYGDGYYGPKRPFQGIKNRNKFLTRIRDGLKDPFRRVGGDEMTRNLDNYLTRMQGKEGAKYLSR
jgi:hypothetical protein